MVTLMIIATTLFSFNVSAVSWKGSAYDTDQVGDVIMDTHVYALNYEDYDNTNQPYKFTLYVTVRLQNTDSDEPAYISQPRFTISPGDGVNSSYVSIENYSVDLLLSVDGGIVTISCDDQFSYGSGIVIPPNSSLYAIGKVELATNSFSWTPSVTNSTFTSTTSSVYTYGQHIDYSPIIDYLTNAATHLDVNNVLTVLSQFYLRNHDDIQALIDLVKYTGSVPSFVPTNGTRSYVTNTFVTGYSIEIDRTIGTSYIINNDFEVDSGNDVTYQIGTKRTPVFILLIVRNTSGQTIQTHSTNIINSIFPNTNYLFNISEFYSDLYTGVSLYSSSRITLQNNKYSTNVYNGIIPVGSSYTYIYGYIDTPVDVNLTFPALDSNTYADFNNGRTPYLFDGYYPKNEFFILKDIYLSMQSNNSTSISSSSNTLNSTESQVHHQEQLYFAQNAQAINDTGLSNYRFNTEQTNGITAVSQDFTSVWNSLGSWTAVYIFSLTLGVALTILRHAPNAISSAIRRRKEND